MNLHLIDVLIIAAYMVATVVIGFWIARRASRGPKSSFLAYGFIGIGKFAATFLPWHLSADPTTNVNLWGLLITALTTIYVVKGGMFSVVFTEVLQACLKTVACV